MHNDTTNPLLDFSGLPRFDDIKPEHVSPAIDVLIAQASSVVEDFALSLGIGRADPDARIEAGLGTLGAIAVLGAGLRKLFFLSLLFFSLGCVRELLFFLQFLVLAADFGRGRGWLGSFGRRGGFYRGLGLERLLRDSHGAQFHPLSAKHQHRFVGRVALGLDPVADGA